MAVTNAEPERHTGLTPLPAMRRVPTFPCLALVGVLACSAAESEPEPLIGKPAGASAGVAGGGGTGTSGAGTGGTASGSGAIGGAGGGIFLGGTGGADDPGTQPFDPNAACATATETGTVESLPVDIIWMVDNSSSMKPAVDQVNLGLAGFAEKVRAKGLLDYRVIMLSLRGKAPIGDLYPICIPALGDANCGNGERYFHAALNVKSTQPLEQLLGTLDQTSGYRKGEERGSEPWSQWLRSTATKSFVIVTDDNARLVTEAFTAPNTGDSDPAASVSATARFFETFDGGKNPFNTTTLGKGILHSSRAGQFEGYTFNAIYGYGSDTNPATKCQYSAGGAPAASGRTYTELVTRTQGARAQLCDGAATWDGFFEAVATSVAKASRIRCDLPIPTPKTGTLDPNKVNVALRSDGKDTLVGKVTNQAACADTSGWYYDDAAAPKRVVLCPSSCDAANGAVKISGDGVLIQFGCETVVVIR